jgi:hypothetical protein
MFSINLLKKNEDALLSLKFDEILVFLNNKLFDCYLVCFVCSMSRRCLTDHLQISEGGSNGENSNPRYRLDQFVQDSVSLRITPFMLDSHRHEYEDLVVRMAILYAIPC